MNKVGITILIIVILALVGIGYLAMRNNNATTTPPVATSTPPVVTPTPTPPVTNQPGTPVVSTDSNATVSSISAVVTGTVKPNGAQTTYWFEYGKTTGLGTQTAAQTIGSGYAIAPTPGYITGLTPSTLYYFRLSAKNSFGTVNGTTYTFTTHATAPAPTATAPTVRSSAATALSRTTATLNGSVNPNGSQTSYWFEYGTTADLGNVTSFQSAGAGTASQSVSVSISGLDPATKYYFRINAQNQFDTVNGSILSFTTNGPPAPSKPTVNTKAATNIASTSATLHGTVTANGAATTYWFEYSTDSLIGNILGTATAEQTDGSGTTATNVSADLTGLSPNTTYNFRLVAKNSEGTVRGDTMSFKTKNQ